MVLRGQEAMRAVPQSSKPRVKAGLEITRGKAGEFGHGTASLIVRKKGASTGAHVVTCAHVLGHVARAFVEPRPN